MRRIESAEQVWKPRPVRGAQDRLGLDGADPGGQRYVSTAASACTWV